MFSVKNVGLPQTTTYNLQVGFSCIRFLSLQWQVNLASIYQEFFQTTVSYCWTYTYWGAIFLSTIVCPLVLKDSPMFQMQNSLSPTQGPRKSQPITQVQNLSVITSKAPNIIINII